MALKSVVSTEERFWNKITIPSDPDACWTWNGVRLPAGYGTFGVGSLIDDTRRKVYAHRFMWEIMNGEIPDGVQILHHCDNPPCVNHEHLFSGSPKDNMQDCILKGRNARSLKTHCPRNHPYSKDNTRVYKGSRHCRACDRERVR